MTLQISNNNCYAKICKRGPEQLYRHTRKIALKSGMVLNHAITTDIHISKINLQFTDEWIRQYVQHYNEKETPINDTIFLHVVSKLAF